MSGRVSPRPQHDTRSQHKFPQAGCTCESCRSPNKSAGKCDEPATVVCVCVGEVCVHVVLELRNRPSAAS